MPVVTEVALAVVLCGAGAAVANLRLAGVDLGLQRLEHRRWARWRCRSRAALIDGSSSGSRSCRGGQAVGATELASTGMNSPAAVCQGYAVTPQPGCPWIRRCQPWSFRGHAHPAPRGGRGIPRLEISSTPSRPDGDQLSLRDSHGERGRRSARIVKEPLAEIIGIVVMFVTTDRRSSRYQWCSNCTRNGPATSRTLSLAITGDSGHRAARLSRDSGSGSHAGGVGRQDHGAVLGDAVEGQAGAALVTSSFAVMAVTPGGDRGVRLIAVRSSQVHR